MSSVSTVPNTTPLTIADRIAAMRVAIEPTPLSIVLNIYAKAHTECAIERHIGLRALCLAYAPISLPTDTSPDIHKEWPIPTMAATWEMHEMAAIISNQENHFKAGLYNHGLAQTRLYERAIYLIWNREIMPKLLGAIEDRL